MRDLAEDVTQYYVSLLMMRTLFEVSNLYEEERWLMNRETPEITCLPVRFQEIVSKAITAVVAIPTAKPEVRGEVIVWRDREGETGIDER